jgi:C1A family cysteine protease
MSKILKLYPSPPDERDRIVKSSAISPPRLSSSVDLSSFCTKVKDQGSVGSCTAFSTVGALEFLHKKFGGLQGENMFSERFTYYATRVNVLNWKAEEDSGAYIRDAIKSVVKYGSCLENSFPYNGDWKGIPSIENYKEALNYQALSYAKFETGNSPSERKLLISTIKAGLNSGFPIVAGFTCYSNIWSGEKGVIPLKNNQIIGGHAILIVGYDDHTSMFKFKNSWTESWGDKGYGYLPYDYYFNGDMFDLWSVYKTENNQYGIGLDIIDPTVKKQIQQSDILDVLQNIQDNINIATEPTKFMSYFTKLAISYSGKQKIVNFVNALRIQFQNLNKG